jgi:hypothetical protein
MLQRTVATTPCGDTFSTTFPTINDGPLGFTFKLVYQKRKSQRYFCIMCNWGVLVCYDVGSGQRSFKLQHMNKILQ